MVIYFLKYLPKINRIVRTHTDLTGYDSFIIQDIGALDATHFPYNDGITTREIYNFNTSEAPDYAIIVDDQNVVTSRWYVEELRYRRNGQCEVSFRRDVLADFKNEVLTATSLIEKAPVSDNDPAIYNQESINFNLIKKAETILKDKTKSAWLVGYLSSDGSANKKYETLTNIPVQKEVAGIANWEYYQYVNTDYVGSPEQIIYNVKCSGNNSNEGRWVSLFSFNRTGAAQTDTQNPVVGYKILQSGDYAYNTTQTSFKSKVRGISMHTWSMGEIMSSILGKIGSYPDIDSTFLNQIGYFHSASDDGEFRALDGMVIHDTTGNAYYKVSVQRVSTSVSERYLPESNSALYNKISNLMNETGKINVSPLDNSLYRSAYVKYTVTKYRIRLIEIEADSVEVTFTASRSILNDAPYTMFAIPFNEVYFRYGETGLATSDPAASMAIAKQISLELMSSGALYDLQLLPYCPRRDLINAYGDPDLRTGKATEHEDYELITRGDTSRASFVLFAKESSFEFNITHSIQITEKKVQNQCDMWRLCSPNYNGVFEFNAAKNDGVDYFNVDCTYRPYNPYIHINPNFKELYGTDFDDARGLVCSGDFSLPACTEKWLEYEAQNKNYQNSFDRSIQHIEIEQKYERINQIVGSVAGVGTGAMSGAIVGGGVGAAVGGALSAAGGIADYAISEKLRTEKIRYAKDQFSFSLENIRALPNSLAKISAFNKNNKIFPFLEHYTCTDIEKQAFRDVIKYDGMTVNRIGKINEFLIGEGLIYIKARLIRSESLHDDAHIIDYLASEMEKGAYYDTSSD